MGKPDKTGITYTDVLYVITKIIIIVTAVLALASNL